MPLKPALIVITFLAVAAFSSLFSQSDPYTSWLDRDVRWIITLPERVAFESLKSDAERDHFIAQFWERRDPTPGTPENEFKEEHYRRVAYANAQFASKTEGALTDRGAVYIRYGPPDRIEYPQPKPSSTITWVYRRFGDTEQEKALQFVDTCNCGEYRLMQREVIETPPSNPDIRKLLKQSSIRTFLTSPST